MAHDNSNDARAAYGIYFGVVVLSCLILSIGKRFSVI